MKMLTFFVLVLLALATSSCGRKLDRCSLAREMFNIGVPKDQLARWACIAQHESAYNTCAVGKTNRNGSQDYGIFQINNKYWCESETIFSYNECKVKCKGLLTADIQPSVKCSQQILKQQGWTAWSVWKYCNGTLPSIDDCFEVC